MNARIVGKSFGSGIYLPGDDISEDAKGRITIQRCYRTLWADWHLTAPSRGSAHPVYKTATLVKKVAKQIKPGFLCDVTLTYEQPQPNDESNGTNQPLPPPEYTESANYIEEPIEAHPDFATFATVENGAMFGPPQPPYIQGKFLGWYASSRFAGILTYKVGSITRSTLTYYWGMPPSVSEVVGQKSGNWLTISGSIARRHPYWTRTIIEIYSQPSHSEAKKLKG